MEGIFFSVIVPVYNVERYLGKCIESIIHQTFTYFELILVDDGSPDKSGQICDEYSGRTDAIRVIHKPNGGLSDARNSGVRIARGKYILFLDSDDYLKDEFVLQELYNRATKFNEDLILYSSINIYKDQCQKQRYGNYNLQITNLMTKAELLNYLYRSNNYPGAAWICCVKKNILQQHDIKFPLGVTGEDYIWILRVLLASEKIGLTNDAVVMHLMDSPGSITSQPRLSGIEGIYSCLHYYLVNDQDWPIGIKNHMAYVYLVGLFLYDRLRGLDKKVAYNLLRQVRLVLSKSGDIRHKVIYYFSSIFGLSLTSRLISFIRG